MSASLPGLLPSAAGMCPVTHPNPLLVGSRQGLGQPAAGTCSHLHFVAVHRSRREGEGRRLPCRGEAVMLNSCVCSSFSWGGAGRQ